MPSDNIYENDPLNYEDFDDVEDDFGNNHCIQCGCTIFDHETLCDTCNTVDFDLDEDY